MKTVFADTGYWIALLNSGDELHQKARSLTVQSDRIPVFLLALGCTPINPLELWRDRLSAFIAEWNRMAHPFNWSNKSVLKVIAKCQVEHPKPDACTNQPIAA